MWTRTRTGLLTLVFVMGAFSFNVPTASAYSPCLHATLRGTTGSDFLLGTGGRDVIQGRRGNDTILGLGGNDIICGNSGEDRLDGGEGQDLTFGGRNTDRCTAEYKEACERGGA